MPAPDGLHIDTCRPGPAGGALRARHVRPQRHADRSLALPPSPSPAGSTATHPTATHPASLDGPRLAHANRDQLEEAVGQAGARRRRQVTFPQVGAQHAHACERWAREAVGWSMNRLGSGRGSWPDAASSTAPAPAPLPSPTLPAPTTVDVKPHPSWRHHPLSVHVKRSNVACRGKTRENEGKEGKRQGRHPQEALGHLPLQGSTVSGGRKGARRPPLSERCHVGCSGSSGSSAHRWRSHIRCGCRACRWRPPPVGSR